MASPWGVAWKAVLLRMAVSTPRTRVKASIRLVAQQSICIRVWRLSASVLSR